jgi:hypothetical protein
MGYGPTNTIADKKETRQLTKKFLDETLESEGTTKKVEKDQNESDVVYEEERESSV